MGAYSFKETAPTETPWTTRQTVAKYLTPTLGEQLGFCVLGLLCNLATDVAFLVVATAVVEKALFTSLKFTP